MDKGRVIGLLLAATASHLLVQEHDTRRRFMPLDDPERSYGNDPHGEPVAFDYNRPPKPNHKKGKGQTRKAATRAKLKAQREGRR